MIEEQQVDKELNELTDFSLAQEKISRLITAWNEEEEKTIKRRKMRDIDVDVEKLRAMDKLRNDETLIPVRVIDTNIKREQTALVAFFMQSRRLAIFKPRNSLDYDITKISRIEEEFTQGMQYEGWNESLVKCVDGAQTHAWDAVEVEYDNSKPLKINIAHIGHENLLFDLKAKKLEACDQILIRYDLSILQLQDFENRYGFNSEAIAYLKEEAKNKSRNNNGDLVKVYKRYFKYKGVVYVCWYSPEVKDKWLKEPTKHFLGRRIKKTVTEMQTSVTVDPITGMPVTVETPVQKEVWEDVDESIYPVKLYIYNLNEQSTISEYKGRCHQDGPKQEAQIALWSVYINGAVRAGNVYASPAQTSPEKSGIPKRLPTSLEHGCIYDQALNFWHTDYPDASLVRAANALETQNQSESGNIAFSVVNRDDSRKTAEEITTAKQQSQLLSGVQVALESNWLRQVYGHCWLIVQSLAAQNLISFLPLDDGSNDLETILVVYDIFPAGDIDVVKREEKLQRRGQFWSIISQTPIAMDFLIDMIREAFPDDAKRYELLLRQNQQQQMDAVAQQNQGMKEVIKELVLAPDGSLKPEFKQYAGQLQQLLSQ